MSEEADAGPLFFLSYAHSAAPGPAPHVVSFFTQLSELVAEHGGLRAGEVPGFMDTSIAGGRQWNRELRTAIGTCSVFVSLLSPAYFASKWCGMEWHAFSQRKVLGADAGETGILPVIWIPWRDQQLPRVIEEVQRFAPDQAEPEVADKYHRDGIRGMIYMGSQKYPTVLWRLAARIVDIAESHSIEPLTLRAEDLVNCFEEDGR